MPARTSRTSKPGSATNSAATPEPASPKSKKAAKPEPGRRGDRQPRGLSALDAASRLLAGLPAKEHAGGLTASELIDRMRRARLWSSPSGKTPQATLYSAIIREIALRKSESRFRRIAPGRFAATPAAKRAAKRSVGSAKHAPTGTAEGATSAAAADGRKSLKRAAADRS